MHELSLCSAIADTAIDHANGQEIERISLRIGHLRQIVPETLQFCWNMRTETGQLAGCQLDVEYIAATIECHDCQHVTTLQHPILRCAECASTSVTLLTGEEFLIESIDITKKAS